NSSVDLTQTLDPGSYSTFSSFDGVPQPGTDQVLDNFIGQAMYRLQYRNFDDYEAMVMNHGVAVSSIHALRWYELRKEDDSDWDIHQQSTFAPDDGLHRWMGSIAMNGNGDIALGYSVSGEDDVYPSIRYTGRTADAPLGEMNMDELELVAGTGSQTNVNRWGDYASMTVDPADDETFWFTTEYITSGWKTRIASFDFEAIGDPVVDAGPDTIICSESLYNTSPATAENASEYLWTTDGDGDFVPTDDQLEVNYLRGNQDIENGGAWLYITVLGYEEGLEAQDSLYLTIISDPTVDAGPDTTICEDASFMAEPEVQNASEINWTTNGDGTFDDPTIADATYTPGDEDIANGEVELNVSVIPISPCEGTDEDQVLLSFEVCSDIDDIDDIESINVYPNPSKGFINLALEGVKSPRTLITVVNASGAKVYEKQVQVRGDRVDHKIDINDQPEGVYFVKTKVNDETITRKVVVR
ncbi:MAG: T9SS type A sorting domain-containing protein, partial [Bacteroidota bacterium]